jgi:hypothetical protein
LYNSFTTSLSVSESIVDIVWTDGGDLNYEIYHIRSTNDGTSWGPNTRLTYQDSIQHSPTVHTSGNVINVIWEDYRDGNKEIYSKRSINGGANWSTDTRLTSDPAVSDAAFICGSGAALHVVWSDNRHGATNYEIYYKRDPSGNANAITQIGSEVPREFSLSQNYPNPFNPVTNIEFKVRETGLIKMTVFDIMGREISVLVNEIMRAGTYKVDFDAGKLSSGIYFYRINAENFSQTKKMILTK